MDETEYIIWYLGQTWAEEQMYEKTGHMIHKTVWLHCVMYADKALLQLNKKNIDKLQ